MSVVSALGRWRTFWAVWPGGANQPLSLSSSPLFRPLFSRERWIKWRRRWRSSTAHRLCLKVSPCSQSMPSPTHTGLLMLGSSHRASLTCSCRLLHLSLHVFCASSTSMIIINLTLPAPTRLYLHLHAASSSSHTHNMFKLVRPAFAFKADKPLSPQIHFHLCTFLLVHCTLG